MDFFVHLIVFLVIAIPLFFIITLTYIAFANVFDISRQKSENNNRIKAKAMAPQKLLEEIRSRNNFSNKGGM